MVKLSQTFKEAFFRLKQRVRAVNRQRLQARRRRAPIDAMTWLREVGSPSGDRIQQLRAHLAACPHVERQTILILIEGCIHNSKDLSAALHSLQSIAATQDAHTIACLFTSPQMRDAVDAGVRPLRSSLRIEVLDATAPRPVAEWIIPLQRSATLLPHSLLVLRELLARQSDARIIYSDTLVQGPEGASLAFKPDFAYDYLLSHGYVEGFCAIHASLWLNEGLWPSIFHGLEQAGAPSVAHIPEVLLIHDGQNRRATDHEQAVGEHLHRTAPGARVERLPDGIGLKVRWPDPAPWPLVSVIIPTKNQAHLLKKCLDALLLRTTYPNLDIVVVDNGSTDHDALCLLQAARHDPRVTVVEDNSPFNYSRLNNLAVREHARGTVLCFMNNDVEAISPDWLETMVSTALRPDVGCVGAKLLYGDGTIQHGGVVVGIGSDDDRPGVASHLHKALDAHAHGYGCRAALDQNLSAVTAACLVMRRDEFEAVGGFNDTELAVAFNDVDLCLKVRRRSRNIVWCAHAWLYHHESVSRGRDTSSERQDRLQKEIDYMRSTWMATLRNDPFYSPNFSRRYANFTPRARLTPPSDAESTAQA